MKSDTISTFCCDPHSQGFGIVNKAEVDAFLELSCFFDDPKVVGNLAESKEEPKSLLMKVREEGEKVG